MNPACDPYLDLLLDSLDGALPAAEQRRLDAHLSACPACVEALRDHVRLRSSLQELGSTEDEAEAAGPLPEALVARFVAAMRAVRDGGIGRAAGGDARTA